ncbi:MAG: acyltransferase [Thaumarchaeota archaeon]|nr:acyltransferase [Candidatus Calditenuaceae archaeon]MDW8187137.1 nitrilase-related carbon-nitrogen hydrolase [Nitrososphaerota archaeon]
MEQALAVGIAQYRMRGNVAENVEVAKALISEACSLGAEIVCLPELFAYYYFPQKREIPRSKLQEFARYFTSIVEELREVCISHEVSLVAGSLVENHENSYYNTSVLIDENGNVVGKYRKTHIPSDECYHEDSCFDAGSHDFRPFMLRGVEVGVLICFDQWFPEPVRAYALNGAKLVFYPTAIGWVSGIAQTEGNWKEAWEVIQRGHAIANSVPIVTVNRIGVEDRITFWGSSFIVDQFGSVIARMGIEEEGVVVRRVDLRLGEKIREGWGFFRGRRPELYSRVTT